MSNNITTNMNRYVRYNRRAAAASRLPPSHTTNPTGMNVLSSYMSSFAAAQSPQIAQDPHVMYALHTAAWASNAMQGVQNAIQQAVQLSSAAQSSAQWSASNLSNVLREPEVGVALQADMEVILRVLADQEDALRSNAIVMDQQAATIADIEKRILLLMPSSTML
jgi:hypothetical protein